MASPDELNRRMVDGLASELPLMSPEVLRAFLAVPRHLFLPDIPPERSYRDEAVPIKWGDSDLPISSSSQPAIMAIMLAQLGVEPGDAVLEIGTGSGYNAAILRALTGDQGRVTSVDLDEDIVSRAERHLSSAGAHGVRVIARDGWEGVPNESPFDRIEVTVGTWDLSPQWVDQLKDGGTLVAPLWLRAGVQATVAFQRNGDQLVSKSISPCGFMRLRGPHAGPENFLNIGGWVVSLDEPRNENTLRHLMAESAHAQPAPPLASGWFNELAMTDDRAVHMFTEDKPWSERRGILLDNGAGLAVVEGDRLLTFGAPEAEELLRRSLLRLRGRRLEELQIRARPTDPRDAMSNTESLLVRQSFSFALLWPAQL